MYASRCMRKLAYDQHGFGSMRVPAVVGEDDFQLILEKIPNVQCAAFCADHCILAVGTAICERTSTVAPLKEARRVTRNEQGRLVQGIKNVMGVGEKNKHITSP